MGILRFISLNLFLLSLAACSFEDVTVATLGSQDNFDDVEIGDDFTPPEDDTVGEVIDQTPVDPMPTQPPVQSLENTFHIEAQNFSLARGPAKRWDGCKNGYRSVGGYNSDTRCGRAFIEEKFSRNLNRIFYKCIFDAAKEANYPDPQRVFINHLGSYNDRTARNSTRLSNHAYARALDIKNFNLVDAQGRNYTVSTLLRDYVGQQAVFYDSFRQCWKDSMPSSCRPGNTEFNGSIGHNSSKLGGNSLHNDHIHLSFPLCAG